MNHFGKPLLLLAGLLLALPLAHAQPRPDVRLRWGLNNEKEFFREIRTASATDQRHFELDTRKAKQEGIPRCEQEARSGKPQSDRCQGLAARLAPVFDFAFETTKPGTLVLERIEVECYRAYRHRGPGYSDKIAAYDVLLPTEPGVKVFEPVHQLRFSGTGSLKLRLWPDFRSQGVDAVDLELRFHFTSGDEVATGRFTLRL